MRRTNIVAVALTLVMATTAAAGCDNRSDRTSDGDGRPGFDLRWRGGIRVVSQNILHGLACPADSDHCRAADRVELFARQLDEAGCPELVGVQEANEEIVDLLRDALRDTCEGSYAVVWDGDPSADREVVLTTEKVVSYSRVDLAGPLRTALWVRVLTRAGAVDFLTTHLASSSDNRPCDGQTCPPICEPSDTLNTCQAREAVRFLESSRTDGAVAVLAGDLNALPGEPTIEAIERAGYVDTHLATGNDECEPATGAQCTSGRADDSLVALTDPSHPTARQTERIDYVFVSSTGCEVTASTGLFSPEPAAQPGNRGGLAFASDHTGVEASLECAVRLADLVGAADATESPTTTVPATTAAPAGAATAAAITAAFETVFDGDVTDLDAKLAAIENGDALRESFLARYASLGDVVTRTRVRVDGISIAYATHADVTYSILLDDTVVLDHIAGAAVEIGSRWLVTTRTYCDVSTQGQTDIPAPCR